MLKSVTENILIRLKPGKRRKLQRRAALEKLTMQAYVEQLIDAAIVTKPVKRRYEKREKQVNGV